MSYNSKYTGKDVDDAIGKVEELNVAIVDAGEGIEEPELDYVTRKVKDAKDLETGELIYLKGHAKATYMSDGKTVEEAIKDVASEGQAGSAAYPIIRIDNSDGAMLILKPNTYYKIESYGDIIDIAFDTKIEGIVNEYVFEFDTYMHLPSLSIPYGVTWLEELELEKYRRYQISIVNNVAIFVTVTNLFIIDDEIV